MASSLEYVQFVADQLSLAGEIRYKKMFGEYGLYCNDQYFAVICDNRFLIKLTQAGKTMLSDGKLELPYEGGSPMLLIEDLEDRQFSEISPWPPVQSFLLQSPRRKRPRRKRKSDTLIPL